MKVTILCANCATHTLKLVVQRVKSVLEELEIQAEVIDLGELPYYKEDEQSPLAQVIANKVESSRGIVAISSVHVAGMHSSMQSFFEHIERYSNQVSNVPMGAITYTTGLGERQATYQMLQAWSMLGGSDGGYLALNNNMSEEYILATVERTIEGFYRTLKQERIGHICSEALAIKSLNKSQEVSTESKGIEVPRQQETKHINLSTQEQNIREFADLLKTHVTQDHEEFVYANTATYMKPAIQGDQSKMRKGLARLPHYFLPQYAGDLDLTIQYIISNSREQGYIVIRDGDCTYEEGVLMSAMVEITLTDELLQQLMTKKITYQKAFMVGKIKVRGNFVLLPKLDQVFKTI